MTVRTAIIGSTALVEDLSRGTAELTEYSQTLADNINYGNNYRLLEYVLIINTIENASKSL